MPPDTRARQKSRPALLLIFTVLTLLTTRSALPRPWRIYTFVEGRLTPISALPSDERERLASLPPVTSAPALPVPIAGEVTAATLADVTHDGSPEWVAVIWRPWQDWPIQAWVPVPSPIETFRDADGESCHLVLLDPVDGRERWAGSALPAPVIALAVGDVTGDGKNEVVTLEGDYTKGRYGPASHVNIWRWNGFGFTLIGRSERGCFSQLWLIHLTPEEGMEIVAR